MLPSSSQVVQELADFIARCIKRLRAICRLTKGQVSEGDLLGDLWLRAITIGEERGKAFDFYDETDQELLIQEFYVAHVSRADHKLRNALRIDQEIETEEGRISWADRLPAPPSSDPFISLLEDEDASEWLAIIRSSYSQAAAYAKAFSFFDNDRLKLSAHLAIAMGTLMKRVARAIHLVRLQPSLFDCIESVPEGFMPQKGKALLPHAVDDLQVEQMELVL